MKLPKGSTIVRLTDRCRGHFDWPLTSSIQASVPDLGPGPRRNALVVGAVGAVQNSGACGQEDHLVLPWVHHWRLVVCCSVKITLVKPNIKTHGWFNHFLTGFNEDSNVGSRRLAAFVGDLQREFVVTDLQVLQAQKRRSNALQNTAGLVLS